MNQEMIFRHVGYAGLSGGFAIGAKLPRVKGNLKKFNVLTIEAMPKETPYTFLIRILKALGGNRVRGQEACIRMIRQLLFSQTGDKQKFILVIEKAYLLQKSVLRMLKIFHEIGSQEDFFPGIVLLGDVDILNSIIAKDKGILMRAVMFTSTQFKEFDLSLK